MKENFKFFRFRVKIVRSIHYETWFSFHLAGQKSQNSTVLAAYPKYVVRLLHQVPRMLSIVLNTGSVLRKLLHIPLEGDRENN